jgi:hypothetical protein
MNFFGIILGIATLFIIGMGFVWVIRGEYFLGYVWWPYFMAAGLLMVLGSAFIVSSMASALVGITGASLIWGSTELKEQAVRAELGWYPFNAEPKPEPPFADTIRNWPAPHL